MTNDELLADCLEGDAYPTVAPRFNRAGLYLEGPECWFELNDGRAFRYPRSTFLYELALREAERLTIRQADALAAVVRLKLATREQCQLLRHYQDAMESRRIYRSSRMHARRALRAITQA